MVGHKTLNMYYTFLHIVCDYNPLLSLNMRHDGCVFEIIVCISRYLSKLCGIQYDD